MAIKAINALSNLFECHKVDLVIDLFHITIQLKHRPTVSNLETCHNCIIFSIYIVNVLAEEETQYFNQSNLTETLKENKFKFTQYLHTGQTIRVLFAYNNKNP